MRVKICGITSYEDAKAAIDFGADALGFVFYEKSPRYITPQKALEIIDKLPPFIERVGLFVDKTAKEINEISLFSKTSLAQLHFETNSSFFDSLKVKYIQVVRANSAADIEKNIDSYRLVDAFVESYGGEGKRIDLSWFNGVDCSKIILAGGLNTSNLPEIANFGFYGVDVSSGVEKSKGVKDHAKIKEFIKIAKRL